MGYSRTNMDMAYQLHDMLLFAAASNENIENKRRTNKRSRKVAFATSSSEQRQSLDMPSPLTRIPGWGDEEKIGMIWYTSEELHSIRKEARSLVSCPEQAVDPAELRGLERHGSRERTRLRKLTNKYILASTIKHKGDASQIGLACRDCSSWARNLAIERGARDELMARGDDRKCLISTFAAIPEAESNGKRALSDVPTERRVRQRLLAVQ